MGSLVIRAVLLCMGFWSAASWADDPRLEACIVAAANYRHIDPSLLKAIAIQESGLNLWAVNRNNANGSVDHGPFQINSSWLPKLKKHGITVAQLYDPCISAYVAAWILADSINRHGATWRAVGAYNSPRESNQRNYARTIRQHYTRLLNTQR
jgi:soluble lytic murein transglycosylase-like protein